MTVMPLCEWEDVPCQATAVVGVGEAPTWLCMDHAEAWLAQLGDTLRHVRQLLEHRHRAGLN